MEQESVESIFRELEERLLRPEVRSSAKQMAELLADEFIEIGSSGRLFDKRQIIDLLRDVQTGEYPSAPRAHDMTLRLIAENVVLLTYRTVRPASSEGQEHQALRSSIWKLIDGRWQMIFHQGTPTTRST
jgi:hypothetical protein